MVSEAARFLESLMRLTMPVKMERSRGKEEEKRSSPPVVSTAASYSILWNNYPNTYNNLNAPSPHTTKQSQLIRADRKLACDKDESVMDGRIE